jgi:dipeptidyl aminopeptidase/acylaminoacyl peptidase
VDPARLVLWGEHEGGTAALLAADATLRVQGVVALDAMLDPWATYRALDETGRLAFRGAAGSDSAAWRTRSALVAATRPNVPVLLVQSMEAGATDVAPATAYEAARRAKGLPVELRLSPREPRPLRKPDVQRIVLGFAERRTGTAH